MRRLVEYSSHASRAIVIARHAMKTKLLYGTAWYLNFGLINWRVVNTLVQFFQCDIHDRFNLIQNHLWYGMIWYVHDTWGVNRVNYCSTCTSLKGSNCGILLPMSITICRLIQQTMSIPHQCSCGWILLECRSRAFLARVAVSEPVSAYTQITPAKKGKIETW